MNCKAAFQASVIFSLLGHGHLYTETLVKPSIQAVILAAGRSTRVKTKASKLTFPFCGQEMILYPTTVMQNLGIPLIMVVGYQKEILQQILENNKITAEYVEQTNAKGTGHAVLVSRPLWTADHILIVNGDGPLINESIITSVIEKHVTTNATVTFVTAFNTDPTLTVARVIPDPEGKIKIIEHKDFEGDRTQPCSINAGIYIMKRKFLEENIEKIPPYKNGELGIPELIHIAADNNLPVQTVDVPIDYVRGVNTQKELSIAERIKRSELIHQWMDKGVRFIDEQTTILDNNVVLSPDTVIGAGAHILKGTKIGSHCNIGAYSIISNSTLENNVTVGFHAVVSNSKLPESFNLRPLAHFENNIDMSGCGDKGYYFHELVEWLYVSLVKRISR